ncbi:hypothetical protein C8Q77DRAFT_125776 [Trametes polyzona]|nr:hypothetical protein C8Q77DRAFT_125776 [Trametes polyzona]
MRHGHDRRYRRISTCERGQIMQDFFPLLGARTTASTPSAMARSVKRAKQRRVGGQANDREIKARSNMRGRRTERGVLGMDSHLVRALGWNVINRFVSVWDTGRKQPLCDATQDLPTLCEMLAEDAAYRGEGQLSVANDDVLDPANQDTECGRRTTQAEPMHQAPSSSATLTTKIRLGQADQEGSRVDPKEGYANRDAFQYLDGSMVVDTFDTWGVPNEYWGSLTPIKGYADAAGRVPPGATQLHKQEKPLDNGAARVAQLGDAHGLTCSWSAEAHDRIGCPLSGNLLLADGDPCLNTQKGGALQDARERIEGVVYSPISALVSGVAELHHGF